MAAKSIIITNAQKTLRYIRGVYSVQMGRFYPNVQLITVNTGSAFSVNGEQHSNTCGFNSMSFAGWANLRRRSLVSPHAYKMAANYAKDEMFDTGNDKNVGLAREMTVTVKTLYTVNVVGDTAHVYVECPDINALVHDHEIFTDLLLNTLGIFNNGAQHWEAVVAIPSTVDLIQVCEHIAVHAHAWIKGLKQLNVEIRSHALPPAEDIANFAEYLDQSGVDIQYSLTWAGIRRIADAVANCTASRASTPNPTTEFQADQVATPTVSADATDVAEAIAVAEAIEASEALAAAEEADVAEALEASEALAAAEEADIAEAIAAAEALEAAQVADITSEADEDSENESVCSTETVVPKKMYVDIKSANEELTEEEMLDTPPLTDDEFEFEDAFEYDEFEEYSAYGEYDEYEEFEYDEPETVELAPAPAPVSYIESVEDVSDAPAPTVEAVVRDAPVAPVVAPVVEHVVAPVVAAPAPAVPAVAAPVISATVRDVPPARASAAAAENRIREAEARGRPKFHRNAVHVFDVDPAAPAARPNVIPDVIPDVERRVERPAAPAARPDPIPDVRRVHIARPEEPHARIPICSATVSPAPAETDFNRYRSPLSPVVPIQPIVAPPGMVIDW